jgi:metacaspase-1
LPSIRAVLAGVNEYERSDIPSLHGCVNDVALVRDVLKTYFGVPNEDIHVLVDRRATKARIVSRLEGVIARARPGDVVVFYFSGHGSQIRDRNGDELADGLDEIICPHDMDWDRGTYIVDDDLDAIFATLPPGVVLEAFFDCCFWGAGTRGLEAEHVRQSLRPDVRYLPPPFDIAARAEGDERRLDRNRISGGDPMTGQNVAWGASHEGQPAAEDVFDGRPNGIFTYWGCRVIAENIERLDEESYSRSDLLEDVRACLNGLGYSQTPELSAPGELAALAPILPGAWVEVTAAGRRGRRGARRPPRR